MAFSIVIWPRSPTLLPMVGISVLIPTSSVKCERCVLGRGDGSRDHVHVCCPDLHRECAVPWSILAIAVRSSADRSAPSCRSSFSRGARKRRRSRRRPRSSGPRSSHAPPTRPNDQAQRPRRHRGRKRVRSRVSGGSGGHWHQAIGAPSSRRPPTVMRRTTSGRSARRNRAIASRSGLRHSACRNPSRSPCSTARPTRTSRRRRPGRASASTTKVIESPGERRSGRRFGSGSRLSAPPGPRSTSLSSRAGWRSD